MKNNKIVELNKISMSGRCIKYTLLESCDDRGEVAFSVSAEFTIGTLCECEIAEDFCRDRKTAERFVYLIASESVEPCHLKDIIYDMLPLYLP